MARNSVVLSHSPTSKPRYGYRALLRPVTALRVNRGLLVGARLSGLSRRRSIEPKPSRRQSPSSCCAWAPSLRGAIRACSYPLYVSCRSAKPALAGRLRTQKPFVLLRLAQQALSATPRGVTGWDPHRSPAARAVHRTGRHACTPLRARFWCVCLTSSRCTCGHPKLSSIAPLRDVTSAGSRTDVRALRRGLALPASC